MTKKSFFKLFAKNLKKSLGPGQYQANGINVSCVHCKHDWFEEGNAQLNTSLATFFNLDFANPTATILTCHKCGYVHWFYKKVNRID
jgi:uncharacterized protein